MYLSYPQYEKCGDPSWKSNETSLAWLDTSYTGLLLLLI